MGMLSIFPEYFELLDEDFIINSAGLSKIKGICPSNPILLKGFLKLSLGDFFLRSSEGSHSSETA